LLTQPSASPGQLPDAHFGRGTEGLQAGGRSKEAKWVKCRGYGGREYHQGKTTERQMILDPRHEVNHVAVQMQDHNGGFVTDFNDANSSNKKTLLTEAMYQFLHSPGLNTDARWMPYPSTAIRDDGGMGR
jgi:hypothetical protein